MAVHHGTVFRDAHGVTGPAVLHLFRLLDALAFKKALRAAGPDLGLIVSARLHADTARQSGLVDPGAYRRLRITNKETRTRAWVWLPPEPR